MTLSRLKNKSTEIPVINTYYLFTHSSRSCGTLYDTEKSNINSSQAACFHVSLMTAWGVKHCIQAAGNIICNNVTCKICYSISDIYIYSVYPPDHNICINFVLL